MRRTLLRAARAACCLIPLAAPVVASEFSLGIPIDCAIGEECRIQQYVDRDPGPGFKDFRCGRLSYDGHKGTDFAVPTLADMKRGVNVLAAADGVVKGWRDGMADVPFDPNNSAAVDGRECGNGVLLRHEGGWETQYCHFRQGSVQVRNGDKIKRGDVLGLVGLSGQTQFPHVHLTVRHQGTLVDPFMTGDLTSCGEGGDTLFDENLDFAPGGVIEAGFADRVPDYEAIRAGEAAMPALPKDAQALVFYAYGFGAVPGDVITLQITGPRGRQVMDQSVVLEKNQALFFRAGGKRLRGPRWPVGTYTGVARMRRGYTDLGTREVRVEVE